MDLREKLRKAAGLFVELPPEEEHHFGIMPPRNAAPGGDDDELLRMVGASPQGQGGAPPARTVEQIVSQADGPNLDEIHAATASITDAAASGGKVDFQAIYKQAALPSTPFTAEQMLDMLASMPAEFPLETRRQTVKVTLGAMGKAIGATPETIVTDASRKLTVLASYAHKMAQHTAELTKAGESEISAMEEQIKVKRKAMELAKQNQDQLMRACDAETDRLDDVLEFFSLDIPPSKLTPQQEK